MSMLDLDAFRVTPLCQTPFDYCVVPQFVRPEAIDEILADFPAIAKGGSFPLASLEYGTAFRQLAEELRGEQVRAAFSEKFDLDLTDRPTTLTVRGRTRMKDGQIHVDSKTKLITVLVYLNPNWTADGGQLRLLGSGDDIDDVVAEVRPEAGMLAAFRCSENAWHGHLPFEGERRSLQLNWVVNEAAVRRSDRRHGLSALVKRLSVKRLNPFAAEAR